MFRSLEPKTPTPEAQDASPASSGPSDVQGEVGPLKKLVIQSSAWTILSYGVNQILRLAGNLILARLLFPEVFGLMTLVNAFMQGLEMFSDLGVGPSILQSRRGEDPVFLRTAWTIQILRGLVICLLSAAVAYPLSEFYHQPEVLALLPVVGLNQAIFGFRTTATFVANRQLKLGRLTALDLFCQILALATMILIAWKYPSVWALVLGGLASSITFTITGHFLLPGISHRFAWDPESRVELVRFGRWIFLSTIFTFFASQGDRLILGRFLDMTQLGIYSIAFGLAQVQVSIAGMLSSKVLLPLYSRLEYDDPYWALLKIKRVRRGLLALSILPAACLIVFAHPLIHLMYDARYQEAGWILRFLAIGALPAMLEHSISPILLAKGDSRRMMFFNLIKSILFLVLMAVGGYLKGMAGLIGGYVLSQYLQYPMLIVCIRRYQVWTPALDLAYIATALAAAAAGMKLFGLGL